MISDCPSLKHVGDRVEAHRVLKVILNASPAAITIVIVALISFFRVRRVMLWVLGVLSSILRLLPAILHGVVGSEEIMFETGLLFSYRVPWVVMGAVGGMMLLISSWLLVVGW